MPLPCGWQAHQIPIKLLAGDKVLVEISPYDLTRGRITYRERNAGAPVVVRVETVPVALAVAEPQRSTSSDWIESLNSLRCLTPRHCCFSSLS